MEKTIIKNAHVISPDVDMENATIVIEGGKITNVTAKKVSEKGATTIVDVKGQYVMPGFIDVHTHGALTHDFCDANPEAVFKLAEAKLQEGVTSFLPTTLTVSTEELKVAAGNARKYAEAGMPYAKIPGIHLEGPFINVKCCGAQNPAYVRKPAISEVKEISKIYPVKMISYAPEAEGGAKFAKDCIKMGVVPSCGHTGAKLSEFMPAYKNGLRHLTHFCNVMTPVHHLRFGMVGGGLMADDVYVEMICDGVHLCDQMIRLIARLKGPERMMLITDAMRASAMPDGNYTLGGLPVIVKDGCARLTTGPVAGSTLRYHNGLKRLVNLSGLPLCEAIRATSLNQAESLGIKDRGRLEKNYIADIVLLDGNLDVRKTICSGKLKWQS